MLILLNPLEFGALILKIMIKRMKKGEEIRSRWCVVLAGTKKKIGRRRSNHVLPCLCVLVFMLHNCF
jgi:hypothetical protein